MQQNLTLQIGSIIYLPCPQYPQRRFQVIKQLGQGGYGVVYQVKLLDQNFYVNDLAIKIQNTATDNETSFIDMLIDYQNNEHQLSQDKKSQIIRVYEKTQYQGNLVTIMELGEGDLYSILQNKSGLQTLNDKIKALNQIAQSVWFLHFNSLIHRDLKPENYIKVGDELKLIDFGLVKFQQQKFRTPFVGSTLFQAPEIKQGSDNYTEAVDIWSLGVTYYEILTENQFNPDNFNIQTLEIKGSQNGFVNLQALNMIKTLLSGMLQINPSNRLKINQVKQELTNIQNLIQLPQKIIPNSFPPFNPIPQKPYIPNQPNQFPPTQNFFPQQKFDNEKKIVEAVATQFSEQNSQLTNLIIGMRDMFVEKFEQQQKQITDIQNQNKSLIEMNLKENQMQEFIKKFELSIKENIESQFKQIKNSDEGIINQLREITQQQNQLIKKQEELISFQTKQFQSFAQETQENITTMITHQEEQLKDINQKLNENFCITQDFNTFKENLQSHQQQQIEENQKNIQNFMQVLDNQFQDLNQLIIQKLIYNQEIHDQQEQVETNNNEKQSSQNSLCQNNVIQKEILNNSNQKDEGNQKNQKLQFKMENYFSQNHQQQELEKQQKNQISIKNQLKLCQQQKGSIHQLVNEVNKQYLLKNHSKDNIRQKDSKNKNQQNAQLETKGKQQPYQMQNQRQTRFDQ